MTDGYWRGKLSSEDFERLRSGANPLENEPEFSEKTQMTPQAPLGEEDGPDSYWQGFRAPDAEPAGVEGAMPVSHADHGGSVSQRARQAYAAEALRQKDHIAAGLLAIFLGVFGIHKFYLGCNQAGFIMLAVSIIGGILTFGLAAAVIEVISIIEGVTYLVKSQTEFDRIYVLHQRDWF